ncbi:hypothetical protein ABCR94_00510 [Streptomyces sp. 21So2-11]|uniref:hypothetical protein n=1 Tax=Streptomyces sp. 21So2-11 TaxID=3144408 RepID=UPI00321C2E9B
MAHLRAVGLGALADVGFRGLDNDVRDPVIVTGFTATRTHELTPSQKDANRVLAVGRAPVEHGFAHVKNWRPSPTPHRPRRRHPPPARPARPDEPRSQPLTDTGRNRGEHDDTHRGAFEPACTVGVWQINGT